MLRHGSDDFALVHPDLGCTVEVLVVRTVQEHLFTLACVHNNFVIKGRVAQLYLWHSWFGLGCSWNLALGSGLVSQVMCYQGEFCKIIIINCYNNAL